MTVHEAGQSVPNWRPDPPAGDGWQLAVLRELHELNRKVDVLMTEDASVLAVVTDEQEQITALGDSVTALQGLVTALKAEPATALQPGTLAALQAAQASLDTLAATGAADVAADTPPATA